MFRKSVAKRRPNSNPTSGNAVLHFPPRLTPMSTGDFHAGIARRAYDLYLARGCEHGHDLEDWLQAERELDGVQAHDEGPANG